MRLQVCAVGRARSGPERALVEAYLKRTEMTGRGIGLGPVTLAEVADRGGGGAAEAALLARKIPGGAEVCALDERGEALSSRGFAERIGARRDEGVSDLAFLIGGAEGLDAEMRARAHWRLSLGKMVWPHMLARVMLAEQLYRAAAILAGAPYHRE